MNLVLHHVKLVLLLQQNVIVAKMDFIFMKINAWMNARLEHFQLTSCAKYAIRHAKLVLVQKIIAIRVKMGFSFMITGAIQIALF